MHLNHTFILCYVYIYCTANQCSTLFARRVAATPSIPTAYPGHCVSLRHTLLSRFARQVAATPSIPTAYPAPLHAIASHASLLFCTPSRSDAEHPHCVPSATACHHPNKKRAEGIIPSARRDACIRSCGLRFVLWRGTRRRSRSRAHPLRGRHSQLMSRYPAQVCRYYPPR
jgi:hypothetical protein